MKAVTFLLVISSVSSGVFGMWPLPGSLSKGNVALRLSPDFDIHLNIQDAPQDLMDAVTRTKFHLRNDKLGRLVVGRGLGDRNAIIHAKSLSLLQVSLTPGAISRTIATEARLAIGSRREEYTLVVPADGSGALLSANSTLGLYRGLTTFEQLWYHWLGRIYTLEAPISIVDSPAYPWRGFMLDTSRNFFPVSDIKRTLDAMSMVKMSQFHWHVVDSQSFPLEVPGFTELANKGAYDLSMVYTSNDVQDIVDYAGARGIDVMVEIDIPGHTDIISTAFPEHIACSEASPWKSFAAEPPSGQLRLASTTTTRFTAELLSAVARMLPSTLMSTGGDEVNLRCYAQDPDTQADLKASGRTIEEALDVFTQKTHAAIMHEGKTPAVWEEMVLNHDVTLSNETVVLVWLSSMNAAKVAEKNFRIVQSPSDYFYLDCGGGQWLGHDAAGTSWCDPFKTWQKAYTYDPQVNISKSQAHLILGGQQLLWAEQSGPENLDSIVWPRAAASAEVFWSGPGGDLNAALPRLHDVAFRMKQRGVQAIPLQPLWCALRPGACNIDA